MSNKSENASASGAVATEKSNVRFQSVGSHDSTAVTEKALMAGKTIVMNSSQRDAKVTVPMRITVPKR